MRRHLQAATTAGLRFIGRRQETSGSFVSYSTSRPVPWRATYTYHTVFIPALILGCLNHIHGVEAGKIKKALAEFLLKQRSLDWTFNYWTRDSAQQKLFPYPDDLDDTCCALYSLFEYNPSLITGDLLARFTKVLVGAESQVGGPYKTWLAPRIDGKLWDDVDPAVNANVAAVLRKVSKPTPQLQHLMEQTISGQAATRYYATPAVSWYFLARGYRGPQEAQLIKTILDYVNDGELNSLEVSLCLSALCLLEADAESTKERLAQQLLAEQRRDGSWGAAAFCIDPTRKGRTFYHGSAVLTTALAIEALGRYQNQTLIHDDTPPSISGRAQRLLDSIMTGADQAVASVPVALRKLARSELTTLLKNDAKHEITLFPYYFADGCEKPPRYSQDFYQHLGLANLFGWLAYGLYDDIIDGDQPLEGMSLANMFLRRSLEQFHTIMPENIAYHGMINDAFDAMDRANAWELKQARFSVKNNIIAIGKLPDYGDAAVLAERSWGHSLTPMAILISMNQKPDGTTAANLQAILRHYLISRQLDDDAHDWQADLARGRISYVVNLLLDQLNLEGEQHIPTILPSMQRHFWYHSLPEILKTMESHLAAARTILQADDFLKHNVLLHWLIDRTLASSRASQAQQQQATEFLKSY